MAVLSPELLADAGKVLTQAGCVCDHVIAVNPDCILYENKMGRARTAWLHRYGESGKLKVKMVEGFPAWPPEGWLPIWPPEGWPGDWS